MTDTIPLRQMIDLLALRPDDTNPSDTAAAVPTVSHMAKTRTPRGGAILAGNPPGQEA